MTHDEVETEYNRLIKDACTVRSIVLEEAQRRFLHTVEWAQFWRKRELDKL